MYFQILYRDKGLWFTTAVIYCVAIRSFGYLTIAVISIAACFITYLSVSMQYTWVC